jgi:hypothetical protein
VLHELIRRIDPLAVLPAGRTAEKTLRELGIDAEPAVRHPANGGATRFRAEAGDALTRLLASTG